MALFKFTKAILDGDEIELYNNGKMRRDFTYIDDVVTSIFLLVNNFKDLKSINEPKNPYRVVNIGSSQKITLLEFLETLERILGKKQDLNICLCSLVIC